jgi:hypothetical protein
MVLASITETPTYAVSHHLSAGAQTYAARALAARSARR